MASCQTKQWVSTAPYFSLTVTQSSSASTTVTLSYTVQYVAQYAAVTSGAGNRTVSVTIDGQSVGPFTYAINGVTGTKTVASGTVTVNKGTSARSASFSISVPMNLTWSGTYGGTMSGSSSISIPAKTSYTISYNANGGSGAPGSQTKWAGTNITLSSTKPTRTGYSFLNWLSSAQNTTFNPGATYSYDASTTMKAQWKANTYTVSYNANGGSGAPSSQTKTHDVTLTLSSTSPTRTNYNFKGWGVSSSSTTASYQPGGSYTSNASITLYAIWELAYTPPRITDMTVDRCDSNENFSDEGKYAVVTFSWATDKAVSKIEIAYKTEDATSFGTPETITSSGTSGTISKLIGGSLDTETGYDVQVTVYDSVGISSDTRSLAPTAYIIDVKAGGKGIAFGKPADTDDLFEVEYPAQFNKSIILKEKSVRAKRCIVGNASSTTTLPWYKFASISYSGTGSQDRKQISFQVTCNFNNYVYSGILNVWFRTTTSGTYNIGDIVIESDTGLTPSNFVLAHGSGNYELWVKIPYTWSYVTFEVISEASMDRVVDHNDEWTLYDVKTAGYASAPTSGYTQITATRGLLDRVYPVGSIYVAYNHTSPASLFGGTWTRMNNTFLWGCDSAGTIGQTGGEKTVTLSINEMPSHKHYIMNYNTAGSSGSGWTSNSATAQTNVGYTNNIRTNSVGNGAAHQNMPPFTQVSIWRRIA